MTEDRIEQEKETPDTQILDGSWEQAHRSTIVAACFGLLIVGVIYAHTQGILAALLFFIDRVRGQGIIAGGSFIENLTQMMSVMKNPLRISVIVCQFLFMLVPTLWIIKRWHTVHIMNYIRVSRASFAEILLAIAVTICFVPVSSGISEFFIKQLNIPDFLSEIQNQIFASYSIEELLWMIVVICVTPALCEEVLFRGYFQRTLERTLGMKSVFIAGCIFGLYHMQPLNLISLSLLGCIIGYFFYRSKSLLPGMAAHFANNLLAIFSMYKSPEGNTVFEIFEWEISFAGQVTALAVVSGLLILYWKITEKNFFGQQW